MLKGVVIRGLDGSVRSSPGRFNNVMEMGVVMDSSHYWPMIGVFLGASVVLAITPGPAVIYIVTRSLSGGRRAGLSSVAGVALGNLGNALGAGFGLGILFTMSATAFTVVKYAGAAYLIWLGLRALRSTAPAATPTYVPRQSARRVFRDGFLVALLNPKTAIFFAAFLPQFMSPEAPVWIQSVGLGAAFILVAAVTDTVYALGAGTLATRLANHRTLVSQGRYLVAAVFISLGLYTALSGSRSRP